MTTPIFKSAVDTQSTNSNRTIYTVPVGKQALLRSVIAASRHVNATGITLEKVTGGVATRISSPTVTAFASTNLIPADYITMQAGDSIQHRLPSASYHPCVNDADMTAVWSISGTQLAGVTVHDIAHDGANTFVVVGAATSSTPYNNFCLVSTDGGVTWTWRDIDTATSTAQTVYSVAYGGGVWCAVGANGFIATSSDGGTTWATRTSANSTAEIGHVIYAGGQFVAVGGSTTTNSIQTSTNGTTWTSRTGATAPTGTRNAHIAHNGTLYVMTTGASGAGAVQTSTDGITWTNRTLAASASSNFVTAKSTQFLVSDGSGYVQTSTDGITWTQYGGISIVPSQNTNPIKVLNNVYYVHSASASQLIYRSTDGTSWNRINFGTSNTVMCYANSKFVFAQNNAIYTTGDLIFGGFHVTASIVEVAV